VTAEAVSIGTPDLTLQECCERWGVSSRNSVKSRAAALGVELRRESSTRTVWPREDVPLGDDLDRHLKTGGTLRDFPGALPLPSDALVPAAPSSRSAIAPSAPSLPSVPAASDALALAVLQLLQQQQAVAPAPALSRARAMAAAADERLLLTTAELAELAGIEEEVIGGLRKGSVLYGFRLHRIGPKPNKDAPDLRAWLLERLEPPTAESVSGGSEMTAVTAPEAPQKRAPGFMAALGAIETHATVLSRLELPQFPPAPLF